MDINSQSTSEPIRVGNARFFLLLAIIVVLVIALASGIWWWRSRAPVQRVPATSVLLQINPNYAKADSLRRAGNFPAALAAYQFAVQAAQVPSQRATIQFLIARMQLRTGDKLAAIDTYKQIASTTSYTKLSRAYAVQTMGMLYYNRARDAAVTKAVFTGEPYASFYDPQALGLSYRKLFNYATSLSPVAGAEYSIAHWYLVEIQHATSTTSPAVIQGYKDAAQTRMAAGDADLKQLRSSAFERAFLPDALLAKAVAEGQMYDGGLDSAENAEAAYKDALSVYDTGKYAPGTDWRARYQYAGFLSLAFGARRQDDIQALLKPLYSGPAQTKLLGYLKLAQRSPLDAAIPRALARMDPQFKALLVSNGWKESDLQ